MARVRTVLDLYGNADTGNARVVTFAVSIPAADEGALMRAFGCNQAHVRNCLEAFFAASLAGVVAKGEIGKRADELIASGAIEVGRPAGL